MTVIKIGTININYEIDLSGSHLVMLHGHGSNLHFFDKITNYLKKNYTVIRYDQRGYGLSDKTPEPPYSSQLWADDLYHLLKKLKIDRAVFAGHSMSGRILSIFSNNHPEMVDGLITLNTTWFGSNPKVGAELERDVSRVLKEGMRAAVEWSPMVKTISKDLPKIAELERKEILKNDPKSYALAMQAVANDFAGNSRYDLLKAIKCPTLILVGDNDSAPLNGAIKMYKGIKNSRLAVIPNSGHCSLLERPEICHAIIKVFLKDIKK